MTTAPLQNGVYLNSDSLAKADIFNEQFRSVFTKENSSRPRLHGEPYPAIPSPMMQVAGVKKLLQQLNVSKSSGPDSIPNRVLQELALI